LRVHAELDPGAYPLGVAISKARMQAPPIEPHPVRGTWNYTLRPAPTDQTAAPASSATAELATVLEVLDDPRPTGMTSGDLDALAEKLGTTAP
jgi:hypothetical protein